MTFLSFRFFAAVRRQAMLDAVYRGACDGKSLLMRSRLSAVEGSRRASTRFCSLRSRPHSNNSLVLSFAIEPIVIEGGRQSSPLQLVRSQREKRPFGEIREESISEGF